jgi:hypothetical protein
MLLLAPAIAIDLLRTRIANWPRWRTAVVVGPLFIAVLVAAEWPFATFLETPAARNWFWGSDYFPYFVRPEWATARHEFFTDDAVAKGLAIAGVIAIASTWIGLVIGDAMRKVRR